MKIGDTFRAKLPPPPTWWEMILWRLFRIHIKRAPQWREYTVTSTSDSDT